MSRVFSEEGRVQKYEFTARTKTGKLLTALSSSEKLGLRGQDYIISMTVDITEHKLLLDGLKASEAKYRNLVENINDVIFALDNEGRIIYISPIVEQFFGYRPGEVTGHHFADFVHPDYLPGVIAVFERALAGDLAPFETRMIAKELQRSTLNKSLIRVVVVDSSSYQQIITKVAENQIRVYGQDITERKQAEEAIQSTVRRFHTILSQLPLGILVVSNDERIEFANGDFYRMFDLPDESDQFIGLSAQAAVEKMLPAYADPGGTLARILAVVATGLPYIGDEVQMRDGRTLMVDFAPIEVEGKALGRMWLHRDITERKRAEGDRQRAAKLESIGTLAGGIAHDFNNVLTGILGNIQLANRYLKQNKAETAKEMLAEAENASLRARDLTQQLLTFSKGGVPVKKVILINQFIRESVTFALRGSRVKPEFAIPDNLRAIEADEGQLNQVISNLVINADHAMPNGGIIKVSAGNIVIKKNNALSLPDGRYIEIAIKDHGIGIPEGNKDRIFEPYFTTKQKGSGLGLATSYSIIKNHGGCITFESELGVGTTFRIYLPASKKPAPLKKETVKETRVAGTGRILVMDDEEMIRQMLGRMLSLAGYDAELTKDGAEAVELYQKAMEAGQPFDAVILDLTVPGGMGGREAIKKLLEIDPHVKAIVSSGYSTDPIMADFKKYGFSAVVAKPYSAGELEKTLRNILTG